MPLRCHSHEGGNPVHFHSVWFRARWIPAFAGMTEYGEDFKLVYGRNRSRSAGVGNLQVSFLPKKR